MSRLGGLWGGLMPGYGVGWLNPSLGYILSALTGSALVILTVYLLGMLWRRR
ncbi:MAG: hypothetical protein HY890_06325 [Deltaproteobacteria bacterium]|nr:hypothetical protein [Deltaproteobacteria bacterium]